MRDLRRLRAALLALAALAAAACSGDDGTTPPDQFTAGPWRGTLSPPQNQQGPVYTFSMSFVQDGRDLAGIGTIQGSSGGVVEFVDAQIDGRFENPDFDFALEAEGYAPVVFDGRVFRANEAALDSIVGTLEGSGFTGRRLVLRRVLAP